MQSMRPLPSLTVSRAAQFSRRALELALNWPEHNPATLGDLVERMRWLPEPDRAKVRDVVRKWAASASDDDKAALLRRLELSMRYGPTGNALFGDLVECLVPSDLVARHEGLLSSQWFGPGSNDEGEDFDPKTRIERLRHRQLAALREIWAERGEAGLATLVGKKLASGSHCR